MVLRHLTLFGVSLYVKSLNIIICCILQRAIYLVKHKIPGDG